MIRELIDQLKEASDKKKCAFCDKTAVKSQDGKPVCPGHVKGSKGCE